VKVVVTASSTHLPGLEEALRLRGFEALRQPLTASEVIPNGAALAALSGLSWWLYPSRSAVRAHLAHGGRFPAETDIGAVGPGTAAELGAAGARVSVVGEPATADGLVEQLMRHPRAPRTGDSIGAVVGDRARSALRAALARHGVVLRTATLYRSRTLPWTDVGPVDAVLVASPSAVASLPAELTGRALIVAIGSTTAESLRERGLPAVEAAEPTITGVMDALERALRREG